MSTVNVIQIPPTVGQVLSNDLTGTVGYRFRPSRDLTVEGVGRFRGSIALQDHLVTIWSDAGVSLAAAIVGPSSPVDELGYGFESLAVPVTLLSGVFYRIASAEFSGGDNWLNSTESSANMVLPNTLASDFDQGSFLAAASFSGGFPGSLFTVNAAFGKQALYVVGPAVRRRRGSGRIRRPGRR